jgi:hypothetical protein
MLHEPPADALRDPDTFQAEVMARCEPAVLRGAARDWPMLSGATTPGAALDGVVAQLRRFDSGKLAEVFVGKPEIGARYNYDATLAGFNFERSSVPFGEALTRILDSAADPGRTSMYMGSMTAETYFPGIEEATRLPFVPPAVRPRFWVGHASTVACHYDTMDNVACVAAGRRRFTLFPPDAIRDLYVGPIDHTLAGQPISLAVGSEPGDPRFPRFENARDRALVVELEPGDALYVPKLWWHQVEAVGDRQRPGQFLVGRVQRRPGPALHRDAAIAADDRRTPAGRARSVARVVRSLRVPPRRPPARIPPARTPRRARRVEGDLRAYPNAGDAPAARRLRVRADVRSCGVRT